jgi:hypothetical protein
MVIDTDALAALGEGDLECIRLAAEAYNLKAEIDAVLKDKREAKLKSLEKEHEELVLQRREHGKTMRDLESEGRELKQEKQAIDKAIIDAQFSVKVVKSNAPNPRYALQSEIAAHKSKVAAEEQYVQVVIARRVANNIAISEWEKKSTAANETNAKLEQQIEKTCDDIEALRTGVKPRRVDPGTGLEIGRHGTMFSS